MSTLRSIEPEWLDILPAADESAIGSRRDIRRLNVLMSHDRIVARALANAATMKPRSIIEIGAGDGLFLLSVARRLAVRWPNVSATLLDRQALLSEAARRRFDALGWRAEGVASDVFDFLDSDDLPDFDIVVANLFLHHFCDSDLVRLFRRIADIVPLFIACEPRRAFPAIEASKLLWIIGCNRVTRHDAAASARAGFRDRELSALWPKEQGWRLEERPAGLFSHSFVASRHAGP
jgi:SAM-dependent methyltransferase